MYSFLNLDVEEASHFKTNPGKLTGKLKGVRMPALSTLPYAG